MTGVDIIAAERQRQIEQEGWTAEHDDHQEDRLARAAVCYAMPEEIREARIWNVSIRFRIWPWANRWWKPSPDNRIKELVKAGALIAAEIDRLQRAQAKQ